ncbi:Ras-related protein RABA5b [Apostasia shenzhenica]|uniref:Ras-related protein RABA5b n=1 Tax=Apostasia shenzhenica TaxID=1088818 RepID=A0A2I0AQE4_9ASPA|nr:Ras-related protein RABA5b [Apostasia shenzhenica]
MLVGNKCDLEDIRAISVEEGKSLAEAEGLFFIETSALDSTNVKTAFEIVIKEIYGNVSRKTLNSDSYKAELSLNRVSLSNNGTNESKQGPNGSSIAKEPILVPVYTERLSLAIERSILEPNLEFDFFILFVLFLVAWLNPPSNGSILLMDDSISL